MNKKECDLAAIMLDMLNDILGNRCCNDFDFPDNWSDSDKYTFVKAFHKYNGDPQEFDRDHLFIPDFCVAGFLSHKLKQIFTD